MSTARQNFLERIRAYKSASLADMIVSLEPTEIDHNAQARLFRNGLAVVGFAILEDFIKSRTSEILQRIGSGATPFSDLPEAIKLASTSGVIQALRFQEKFYDKRSSDYYRFFQSHARAIASTGNTAYEISSLSFGYDQSNITSTDVAEILTALCIDNHWSALGRIASRVGIGVVDLKSFFNNAAARRHIAAHQASADIETTDLINYGYGVVGLAMAFDLLISRALRIILDANREYLTQKKKISGNHISIRFLTYDGKKWWRETVDDKTRALKRDDDIIKIKADCIVRARLNGQAVVLKGDKGFPEEWFTPDID